MGLMSTGSQEKTPFRGGMAVGKRLAVLLLVLGTGARGALALTDEEIFRDFRFNLINPGARSLALGGAFISLADDATAAQANPAGLSIFGKPEYFLELRGVDSGAQSSVIKESQSSVSSSVATGTNLSDVRSPTFASAVFPIAGNLVLGFSRQEVLHSTNSTVNSFVFTFPNSPGKFSVQGSGSIDVRQTNYNVSAGYRVPGTGDRLAIGTSVAYSELRVRAEVTNTIVDTGGSRTGTPILEPTLDLRTRIRDSDSSVGFSLGALLSLDPFRFGVVYRRAPKFSVDEVIDPPRDTNGDGTLGEGDKGIDTADVRGTLEPRFRNTFNIPDSYGIGVSWVPKLSAGNPFTLAFDVERVQYSDLLKGYVPGVNVLTDFDAKFTVDDATDFRLGAEYVIQPKGLFPLALRAGVFTQSDNTIRARSTGTQSFATKDAFPGRDRQFHGAGGLGVVWRKAYKVDFAFDLAHQANEYVVSFIYSR